MLIHENIILRQFGEKRRRKMGNISQETMNTLLMLQQNETNEAEIYAAIARYVKNEEDKNVLLKIAKEEAKHAEIWSKYTNKKLKAKKSVVRKWTLIAKVLGYTFALKKMEKGESMASQKYQMLIKEVPEAESIKEDEDRHEQELIAILNEERLQYVGSMVLGLSDALVELSGTLAGLTFALQNTRLIALSGLITGISATLSMASSEYLSAKSDGNQNAKKSALYTGIAYLISVAAMVMPYLLLPSSSFLLALLMMLAAVVIIIALFSYYISVAKDESFRKRFFEMAGISLSVAAISFLIGILAKQLLGVDI